MSGDISCWGPVLVGERVRLEPIDSAMAQSMLDGAPDSGRAWEDGFPMRPVLAIARVIADATDPLGPFSAYVIVRRSDGLAVGDAGFHGSPSAAGEVEVGYALVPAARGAGLVHEAMRLLISWAWSQPAVRVITARVDAANRPSERVLQRLGFALDGERDGMSRYALCGLATGAAIGWGQGQIITRLRLPPFVVTLGGLLFWEGLLIWLINNQSASNGGSIRIVNQTILNIDGGSNMSVAAGWISLAVVLGLYAAFTLNRARQRRVSGLVAPPLSMTLLKLAAVAVAGIALVAGCSVNRSPFAAGSLVGVPWVVPIVLVLVVAFTFLLDRTRFGRYVYAIGGNREAARRAGISVNRIRVLAYMLAGFTATAALIIVDSRGGGATTSIDGGQTVLYGVAAAVIGGTSLLGGRGKMVHALLGGLVIATIYNGMGLISLSADIQYMVTALVLIAAATVDALSRRGQST